MLKRKLNFPILFLFSLILLVASCSKPQTEYPSVRVSMHISEVGREAGTVPVVLNANDEWTVSIQYDGESGWAGLDRTKGDSSAENLTLTFAENTSGKKRSLKLLAACGTATSVWNFTQSSSPETHVPDDIVESTVGNWLELPAVSTADGLYFFSHRHEIHGHESRDWSFYWDNDSKVSHWVAYPLNAALIAGTGLRTNAWAYDPLLPEKYQPCLHHSFGGGYQRGHLLPSASRQIVKENEQTFYFTNMTPQKGELNEKAWAALEGRVRDWSRKLDTLYVVTGCTLDNSIGTVYDNNRKAVKIPGGYYKALLGFSRNGTASRLSTTTGGYTSIAFYFPHREAKGNIMDYALTVDELEERTGMDFFVNLPSRIGESRSKRVETAEDEFWFK